MSILASTQIIPTNMIRKKGRCIRFGESIIYCHKDDYKQLCRKNKVGLKRLKAMIPTHHIPEDALVFSPPKIADWKFAESDRYEARYAMYYDIAKWHGGK